MVILAAGEGTRMKSDLSKVLHQVCGRSMISYVFKTARKLKPSRLVVVVGHKAEEVSSVVGDKAAFVVQDKQLGTAHAVQIVYSALKDFKGKVLVLYGDSIFITTRTLRRLIKSEPSAAVVLTARLENPTGYGRIIRHSSGALKAIVEEKDATPRQRQIKEVNTGTYCFDAAKLFPALKEVRADNKQKELYLTDVVGILTGKGEKVLTRRASDWTEALGVNSRQELAVAEGLMKAKIMDGWMSKGVTFIDPVSTFIGPDVVLGRDTIIHPFSFLYGNTSVGKSCVVGPLCQLTDAKVGRGVIIQGGVIRESVIEDEATLGPYCFLRPGTRVKKGAKVGAFVEVKRSQIGEKSKVPHLSYIGDAIIGRNVNVGAGSITCNFDGTKKHRTVIEDGAFIGSDTMLVAPVTVGRGAFTGAGSAISKDVPKESLAVERSEQTVLEGWAKKHKKEVRRKRPKRKSR